MKLKVGNWIIHEKAQRKLALVLFLIGIHVSINVADREIQESFSTVVFIVIYVVIIPRVLGNRRDDIERIN